MQFSSIFSLASLAAAAAVPASTFSLITIHSGSDVQYQSVKLASDGNLSLNGETDVSFSIDSDGFLYANGDHVDLNSGAIQTNKVSWSGGKWTNKDGHLALEDSNSFVVCPNINSNIMYAKYGTPSNCQNPIGVALRIVENN